MSNKHYKYGSSTAERTINCPAWATLSADIPRGPASAAAEEGTAMHSIYEDCLNDGLKYPEDFIGKVINGIKITEAMAEKVTTALEATDIFIDEYGLFYKTEYTMEHSPVVGGTIDFLGWNKEHNVVCLTDLKTGDGYLVNAKNNSQLLFGAALAIQDKDLKLYEWVTAATKIILVIVQPSDRRDDPVDYWETDLLTVTQFWDSFIEAVRLGENGGVPNSGRWCKFCAAQATCPEKTGVAQAALRLNVNSKERETLNAALQIVDEVEDWVRAVRKLAHEQMELGVKFDGWKLVPKRATRQWGDEYAVESFCLDNPDVYTKIQQEELYEHKFLSVAKLEKLFSAKGIDKGSLEDYIVKQSSGTTMAHEDDKRDAVYPINVLAEMAKKLKN